VNAPKGEYKLRELDVASLARTEAEWKKQLQQHAETLSPSSYLRILDWAATHMTYGGNAESFAYGLFRDDDQHADAILDVCYTKSGKKWLKMLELVQSPDIDHGIFSQTIDPIRVIEVYGASLLGTAGLTSVHPSATIKLFGRSEALLAFYVAVCTYLVDKIKIPHVKVAIEGRFLVIRAIRGSLK
jgi:hypothetical protein